MAGNDKAVSPVSVESISDSILLLRGQKLMLNHHLAVLYGVEARVLIQAVKRNIHRFPKDFMFQSTKQEVGVFQDTSLCVENSERHMVLTRDFRDY